MSRGHGKWERAILDGRETHRHLINFSRRAITLISRPSKAQSSARCFYYLFMVVVITYKTKATACRALTFILRIFVNDTIATAVWTRFDTITIAVWISLPHMCAPSGGCSDYRAM